ncbi:MAG TPA: nuclear transport factor 2 family protein [Vicinamibacterales bacterium]|nr:nuclear transport factor 2 family protein [Vicinamibacterales bacterium]
MHDIIKPPFTLATALLKVQAAEDVWNSRDPDRVARAYSPDSTWRNRTEFLRGRQEIEMFLRRKWATELDYRLKKTLWGFRENRIAVSFEYEWHDASGQWFRSYGTELWEFDPDGLMRRRLASINDAPIDASERRVHRDLQDYVPDSARESGPATAFASAFISASDTSPAKNTA